MQGIGHTLSGYASHLLEPELTLGSSPPSDGQQAGSPKLADAQQQNGHAPKQQQPQQQAGMAANAATHCAATSEQAGKSAAGQEPQLSQLRSRRQMQACSASPL